MRPDDLAELVELLPDEDPFLYFRDREAPWLLAQRMAGPERVSALRSGPHAALMERPLVKALAARCGDGWLHPGDVATLAEPEAALGARTAMPKHAPEPGPRAEEALTIAAGELWRYYSVSFTSWGVGEDPAWTQMSRPGGNLVLQLNFPAEHHAVFHRHFGRANRKVFECPHHPIRRDGPITMAWARLDLDPWGAELLIEEVQADWFRLVDYSIARLSRRGEESRMGAMLQLYRERVLKPLQADWARALMLAVLAFARRDLGVSQVYMHAPETGARLKRIDDTLPPVSLYTRLPKRFGFEPVSAAPGFIERRQGRAIRALRASGDPVFWRLSL